MEYLIRLAAPVQALGGSQKFTFWPLLQELTPGSHAASAFFVVIRLIVLVFFIFPRPAFVARAAHEYIKYLFAFQGPCILCSGQMRGWVLKGRRGWRGRRSFGAGILHSASKKGWVLKDIVSRRGRGSLGAEILHSAQKTRSIQDDSIRRRVRRRDTEADAVRGWAS